jgi:heat shock protein HslJ
MMGYDYSCESNMYTKLKSFILTALLFTLHSGVSGQVQPTPEDKYQKSEIISQLDGKWYLQNDITNDSSNNRTPEIKFDIMQNRFSGNTGCNQMSGSFTVTEKTLRISDKMITTRMFCPGYDEMSFLKNLLKADGYHFHNGLLIMTSGDSVIYSWSRKINPQKKT